MNRFVPLLSVLTTALIIGSACTDARDGHAKPGQTAGRTASTSADPAESASVAIDPCTLLDAEQDLNDYGDFKEPQYKELAGARDCYWQRDSANPLDEGLGIGLAIRDAQTVEVVRDVGGGVRPGKVNGRPAAEAPNPQFNDCTLVLKIDDQSRIDINISAMRDVNAACQVARDIAYLIEPRLPDLGS